MQDMSTPLRTPEVSPIRVLIANDHLGFGDDSLHGVGRLLIEWATGFDLNRVQPTVCCLRKASGLGRRLVDEGVPLTFFGMSRFNPHTVWKFVHLIRSLKIDVLHLNGFGASTFGRIAGLLTHTPSIVHVHDTRDAADTDYPRYVQLMDRLLAPFTACAIAVSMPVKTFCIERMGFHPDQVKIVHNPSPRFGFAEPAESDVAALRAQYGLGSDMFVAGTTSRLKPEKGIHVLVEAVAKIRRDIDFRLLVVGDGPTRSRLESLCRRLGILDRVIFAGFRRDIAAHLRLMSVLVIPSTWQEPFPLAALEAFGAGRPVIASRIGGLPEAVIDGYNGILIPPGDVDALAKAIMRLAKNSELTTTLGRNALAASKRFSIEAHTSQLEKIYRDAAGQD